MAGDGNCMFRGLCHQLYRNGIMHMSLRYAQQGILANNVNKYWMGPGLFTDHIKQLRKSDEWGYTSLITTN